MKPKTQRVYEVIGDLGDHLKLYCIDSHDVLLEFLKWKANPERKLGDTLTITIDEMSRKQISKLEQD